ncbi:urease accessory protein UreF [Promicromonospora soli]|uniref:Urease accessory protein (UreF) n=1 Tax=Promicromonospora soli TaxID=2035533 RepID=A0A919G043_9MICO|nr:urease accessory UreF family protein [Promicromonospora soli]GHH74790.1 urease accessory protein (UreF) [Promicromonospora soli]
MTSPHALSVAMLLADARLPSGGHAHSASLEPALLGGMPTGAVPAWLVGRATTVSLVEAGTAVVTARLFAAASEGPLTGASAGASDGAQVADPFDSFGLADVVGAWAARTPAPALRDAARLLGRGYLRLARTLWPDAPAVRALVAHDAVHGPLPRAIVLGAVAAATGLPAADTVRLTVYDDAQTAASALLKLEPLDPVTPARWVLEACAAAEQHVLRVAACTTPEEIPASGSPQTEGWAQAHALLSQRLFRA